MSDSLGVHSVVIAIYNASLRYLSNFNTEGYMVFPLEGDPTLFTFIGGYPTPWVADNRTGHPNYSKAISERLRELHLEKARIGLVELSGYNGEAGFPHTTYVALTSNFPEAKFEDATDIIVEARMIKSRLRSSVLSSDAKLERRQFRLSSILPNLVSGIMK